MNKFTERDWRVFMKREEGKHNIWTILSIIWVGLRLWLRFWFMFGVC